MSRQSISSLSKRGLALKVLSKLLYAVADSSTASEELEYLHQEILNESLRRNETANDSENDSFNIGEIPWGRLLDSIACSHPFLRSRLQPNLFSPQEIRYMCAMICGLSGKEYGLITGLKSQYNLSWSIRHKIGMPAKTTNLRNFLQKISENEAVLESV